MLPYPLLPRFAKCSFLHRRGLITISLFYFFFLSPESFFLGSVQYLHYNTLHASLVSPAPKIPFDPRNWQRYINSHLNLKGIVCPTSFLFVFEYKTIVSAFSSLCTRRHFAFKFLLLCIIFSKYFADKNRIILFAFSWILKKTQFCVQNVDIDIQLT